MANIVLEKGCIQLKQAFEIVRPDVAYKSKNAKRLLPQMPLASVAMGTMSKGTYRVSLVEKQNHIKYKFLQSLLNQWWECKASSSVPSCALTRDTVTDLLKLAETDAERKRLKYTIMTAAGLSGKKAAELYGFSNISSTVSYVEDVLLKAHSYRYLECN